MYSSLKTILALGMASVALAQHSKQDDEMGPAAFMWPADRVWSGDMDNQEPCGSRSGVANRTEFPLVGGKVALVAQDDYYNTQISISYSNDPKSNSDFTTLIKEQSVADLNPGHTCVDIPNPPSQITAGSNATLQIIYRADWDAPHNQTFYACADIRYVEAANFVTRIPCFNATEPGEDDIAATAKPSSSSAAGNSGSSSSSGGGSKGLSGGAIAGIVIGAVAGVALLIGAALFFYRRSQQQKRNSRLARMEENARNSEHWNAAKDSTSQSSVQLQNR
ncbi:GPI-anchored protein [Colletotrichum truncatum]|uniref:GPI-anchored protein n=1 Tax=Colletotrichum truncatum TaxID=5467 RepID=A0ACC3Z116_COLTU|nr:GPI-anchored protein [Colletotrichum truncatum]XP_036588809.1 GPI-anchored protein [Colletotrichum truncatum]KAF6780627.1 GPI-anchored protein [Colletotrichum truncatum]KAF6800451.1 GPI-anchored protein [Colletotrichum truncatum]